MITNHNEVVPIALFTYNRPEHAEASISAILKNALAEKCDIYIYSDGPKNRLDEISTNKVRRLLKKYERYKNIKIICRDRNFGLANSIISGTTELVSQYGQVIVLEDDLEVSPHFIDYMKEALWEYRDHPKVLQISAFGFNIETDTEFDAYFLPFTTSWGWGTWKDSWNLFDFEMKYLKVIEKSPELIKKFNLNNSVNYYAMAVETKRGNVDSWAIRWYLSNFKESGLTLYPKKTLVKNNGFDGTGTNCRYKSKKSSTFDKTFQVKKFPKNVAEYAKKENIFNHLKNYDINNGFNLYHAIFKKFKKLL